MAQGVVTPTGQLRRCRQIVGHTGPRSPVQCTRRRMRVWTQDSWRTDPTTAPARPGHAGGPRPHLSVELLGPVPEEARAIHQEPSRPPTGSW